MDEQGKLSQVLDKVNEVENAWREPLDISEEEFAELLDPLHDYLKENVPVGYHGYSKVYLVRKRDDFRLLRLYAMLARTCKRDRNLLGKLAYPKVTGKYKGPGYYKVTLDALRYKYDPDSPSGNACRLELVMPYICEGDPVHHIKWLIDEEGSA